MANNSFFYRFSLKFYFIMHYELFYYICNQINT